MSRSPAASQRNLGWIVLQAALGCIWFAGMVTFAFRGEIPGQVSVSIVGLVVVAGVGLSLLDLSVLRSALMLIAMLMICSTAALHFARVAPLTETALVMMFGMAVLTDVAEIRRLAGQESGSRA